MSFKDIFKKSFLEGFSSAEITTPTIVIALGIACVLALYIFFVYRVVTRKTFYSKNFNITLAVITVITAALILTMQSSVVLSLGMVGALSIVRFRTAVKDPLDTAYMFWALTMGILLGAGQFFLTALAVVGIAVLITVLVHIQSKRLGSFLLVIRMGDEAERAANQIVAGIRIQQLKSKTVSSNGIEATYEVRVDKPDALLNKLRALPGVYDATLVAYSGEAV